MDRFLEIVVPAALVVELMAAVPRFPVWLAWALRLTVAGCLARVLLHGSIYLSDPAEAGLSGMAADTGRDHPGAHGRGPVDVVVPDGLARSADFCGLDGGLPGDRRGRVRRSRSCCRPMPTAARPGCRWRRRCWAPRPSRW